MYPAGQRILRLLSLLLKPAVHHDHKRPCDRFSGGTGALFVKKGLFVQYRFGFRHILVHRRNIQLRTVL